MADIYFILSLRISCIVELHNETVKLKSSAEVLLEGIDKKKPREVNIGKQQLEIITNRMADINYHLSVIYFFLVKLLIRSKMKKKFVCSCLTNHLKCIRLFW